MSGITLLVLVLLAVPLIVPVESVADDGDEDEDDEPDLAFAELIYAASDAFVLLLLSLPLPRRLPRLDMSLMYYASSFCAIASKAQFSAATRDGVHALLLLHPSPIFVFIETDDVLYMLSVLFLCVLAVDVFFWFM